MIARVYQAINAVAAALAEKFPAAELAPPPLPDTDPSRRAVITAGLAAD